MNRVTNQIYIHIIKSTKTSLIDDLSKRLLELEFKSNPSVRSKMGCQNMKNTHSETKPIKIEKRPGTTYCFGCKDFTHIFRPQQIKMTNKVLRKK